MTRPDTTPPVPRCQQCGHPYITRHPCVARQRYCSQTCRRTAAKARERRKAVAS